MAHVEGEIIIYRPIDEVFDFAADERNEPRYNVGMLRSELISEGPIGLGSQFHAVMAMRGKPVNMTVEFTAFDRPRLLGSSTHLSNMDIDGKLIFEAVPDGTRMRWFWDLHPKGFLKLMMPLVRRMGERQELRIWTEMKHILETEPAPALQR